MTAPTALVTGAGRGIGRAAVDALLGAGWRVVAGVRDPAVVAELGAGGPADPAPGAGEGGGGGRLGGCAYGAGRRLRRGRRRGGGGRPGGGAPPPARRGAAGA